MSLGGGIPIIPAGEAQWKRFEKAKAQGTEWFGYVYRDGHWVRVSRSEGSKD